MLNLILAFAAAAEEATHGAAEAPAGIFEDPTFWVLVAFLVVIAILARADVPKRIVGVLDKRAQSIADELDRARALRDEAQELLAKYQRRQREAEEEAESIIEQAKIDAERIADEARAKIEEQLERRAKAAEEKIARAEAQAIAEVRSRTVDIAIEAARDIIRSRMDQGAQSALAERAIDELGGKLH
ncbi:MAG: F0F1 ATP synthase subunit B [Parvularculaceae bacterium]|nr:F0F1 ATP synthase subunit B [Parvularculaceae bacterium]